jgi:hypothetical protein
MKGNIFSTDYLTFSSSYVYLLTAIQFFLERSLPLAPTYTVFIFETLGLGLLLLSNTNS